MAANQPSLEFLTPVGRLVGGDPYKPFDKDLNGQQMTVKTGPNAGQPTQKYVAVIAFAKNDPAFVPFYQKWVAFAAQCWPQYYNAQNGTFTHPQFSLKLVDGDGMDSSGKSNASKEGYAGHWLMRCQTTFAPACYQTGHYQPHEKIGADSPGAIKRGFYVRIHGDMQSNNNAQKPGLFVNHDFIELCGLGPEMKSGPDVGAIMQAAQPVALPAGAQALPAYMAAPGAVPGMVAAQPAVGAAPLLPPGPVGTAPPVVPMAAPVMAAPTLAVQPNHAALAGPGGALPGVPPPMAPPPLAPPPVAPVRTMTALAQGHTYESMIGQGWTDALLLQHGMMT